MDAAEPQRQIAKCAVVAYNGTWIQHSGSLSSIALFTLFFNLLHELQVFYAYAFDFTDSSWRGLMVDVSGLFLSQDATPPTCAFVVIVSLQFKMNRLID
jgi:hypothetical protein